jgi:RNA polymerase sigma factor for flagellar operon FliA
VKGTSCRAAAGADAAREAILSRHLPLVRSVAHALACRHPPRGDFEDLVSWGIEGLLDAYARYRAERRTSFAAYARFRIRGAILDNLRATDPLSRTARRKAILLERTRERLEGGLGRRPTHEEMARALEIDLQALWTMAAQAEYGREISLEDVGVDHDGERDPGEPFPDERADPQLAVLARERLRLVAAAVERLSAKERATVTLYYAKDLTMREVGERLGLTESRVSQLHFQALGRLRALLGAHFGSEPERCAHA